MTVSRVLETVLRDMPFYQTSGGGMTLSGGEPLYQSAFSCELLKEAKKMGLHTCVETSGFAAKQILQEIAAHTDLFLYDWKLTDPNLHHQYTGVSNTKIRENLYLLSGMGKEIILRCPVIPGVNDTTEHFSGIAELADELDAIRWVELEPYHPLGSGKSAMLGKAVRSFTQPGQDIVARWQAKLSLLTEKEIKIG